MRGYIGPFIVLVAIVAASFCVLPRVTAEAAGSNTWKTDFGAPDLQGIWTSDDDILTPLEKPSGKVRSGPANWYEAKPRADVHWLIREPDGTIPPMTPWAEQQTANARGHRTD